MNSKFRKRSSNLMRCSNIDRKDEKRSSRINWRIFIPILFSVFLVVGIIGNNNDSVKDCEALNFEYASPESLGISSNTMKTLADTINGYYEKDLIVGAELVVIKNHKIILHETVGWKDLGKEIPMEKNTPFNIRSMTKPITGAAIQILIDETNVSLDSTPAEYLHGFKNDNSKNITIEQLLTHRSGLPLSIITATNEFETLQEMANEAGKIGPKFTPGSKFWYSDAGVEVLGAIVEIESGESLDTYVIKNLLEPLGMNNSFYYHSNKNDSRCNQIPSIYFGGVGKWMKIWSSETPLYPFAFGSQSLYSTPLDYARFLAMWLDKGKVQGAQLLSEDAVVRTLTPVIKMSSLGSDIPYPTGFFDLESYYGQMSILYSNTTSGIPKVEVIGQSGSDGTHAWAWPKLDLIILYFTQSRGGTSGIKLESKIDELLIHPELNELNNQCREKYSSYLGSYTANYGPFRNSEFVVTVQNGHLAVDIPNEIVYELNEPDEDGRWTFRLISDIAVSFEFNKSGNVRSMKLYEHGQIYELPKGLPPEEEVYPNDMEKYTGFYKTEDPKVTIELLIHEGKLALKITGQPSILEMYPPDDEGKWYLRVNPSIAIKFNKSEDGEIVSFSSYLPDGTSLLRTRIEDG